MTRGQQVGGWPLTVASLSLAAGILFGVHTVQVQEVPVPEPSAPSTVAPRTVTSDQFVAQMASRIARQLRHRGIHLTSEDLVELLTDGGDPGVIVGPATTVPRSPLPRPSAPSAPSTSTTSTTTTTTEPPLLDLNDRIDLGHLPDRAAADPPPASPTATTAP